MYIVKTDYKGRISTDLLDLIIAEADNDGDDILASASKTAEDTISTTAGVLYDLTEEFTKAGAERNHMIVDFALNICAYLIYQRVPDDDVPKKVIKNYDDTMENLVRCSNGKFPLKLPAAPVTVPEVVGTSGEELTPDGGGLRRIVSAPKRSHRI